MVYRQSKCCDYSFERQYENRFEQFSITFAYNWGTDVCWVAPPPYLIAKVLIHAESNKAKGICFIPKWEAAIFWPIVIKLINNKKITLIHEFVRPCKTFIKGSLLNKIFTEETCSFNMLVFKFKLIFFTLLILIT